MATGIDAVGVLEGADRAGALGKDDDPELVASGSDRSGDQEGIRA